MRKRPFLILVCSLVFLYFPIGIAQRMYQQQPVTWVEGLLNGVFPLILIGGLVRVTKLGWYTLVGFVLLWGIHDLQLYYGAKSHAKDLLIHIGIYMFSMTYFINPRVRHLYFDPKSRWWRTKERFETHFPILIKHSSEWQYPILRNLSEGGCFLETQHAVEAQQTLRVVFPLPVPLAVSTIEADGVVRWSSNHPSKTGMGIQFLNLGLLEKKALVQFLKKQL